MIIRLVVANDADNVESVHEYEVKNVNIDTVWRMKWFRDIMRHALFYNHKVTIIHI